MPFITSVERIGYERGYESGLKEGLEKGLEKAREQGEAKGLHSALELGLELRFGADGRGLMPQVRQCTDLERLRGLVEVVKKATLDEVRQALA